MKARGKKPADDVFESMVLHDNACFLCGERLKDEKSNEHVFPKWLQHKHNLWNRETAVAPSHVLCNPRPCRIAIQAYLLLPRDKEL